MISLTMSRISSRAASPSRLGELGEIDRVDQRAEDRALGLVVFLGLAASRPRRRRASARPLPARARRRAPAPASDEHGHGRRRSTGSARRGRTADRPCERSCSWTLAEHRSRSSQRAHEALRRANRARIGSSRLACARFGSLRPVIAGASSRNASAILPGRLHLGDHLAVVGGRAEQLRHRTGATATSSMPSALAKSAAEISGRFGTPTWLSTSLGGGRSAAPGAAASKRFLALRRLARSGAATMTISSAPISVRLRPRRPQMRHVEHDARARWRAGCRTGRRARSRRGRWCGRASPARRAG